MTIEKLKESIKTERDRWIKPMTEGSQYALGKVSAFDMVLGMLKGAKK